MMGINTGTSPGLHRAPIHQLNLDLPDARTPNPDLDSSSLNLHDLNLLQHYILCTSENMSLSPRKSLVWERVIPKIAAKNAFLMHLLLALAGLDLLRTQSHDRRMHLTSDSAELRALVEHHQNGLKGLQEELLSNEETNAEVLFAGSMLIVGFAFGSLRVGNLDILSRTSQVLSGREHTISDISHPTDRPHVQWLRLVRGVVHCTTLLEDPEIKPIKTFVAI